jgi:hypothetical protein
LRPGSEYFLQPDGAAQRRYEALRAYFVEGLPADPACTTSARSPTTPAWPSPSV